jgi:hypothetical protein
MGGLNSLSDVILSLLNTEVSYTMGPNTFNSDEAYVVVMGVGVNASIFERPRQIKITEIVTKITKAA